jgi:hypothetical protein
MHRYIVWPRLLKKPRLNALYEHALCLAQSGAMRLGDSWVPGTPSLRAEPKMEALLRDLLPQVESATGLRLYPTYSYFRVYKQGDVLKRHKDRPACEISISLTLGIQGSHKWPLCIQGPLGSDEVYLDPGDALLYRGIECAHWREAFRGEHMAQVFLHYVDQNGPYAEHKYDKRCGLNLLPE